MEEDDKVVRGEREDDAGSSLASGVVYWAVGRNDWDFDSYMCYGFGSWEELHALFVFAPAWYL